MQYSKINLLNRPMIIDVKEGEFLNSFIRTKQMPPVENYDDVDTSRCIVYGAVLHNEGCETINHHKWMGYSFAYPSSEGYKLLTITDIYLTPTLVSGGLRFTPFAALVESDSELEAGPEHGISAFLRYEDMDIITNLLNRECIYAIREIENRKEFLYSGSWKSAIDESHLLEIAFAIE